MRFPLDRLCATLTLAALLAPGWARAAEPALDASLIDRDAKARKGWATIQVEVRGIDLVDSPTGRPVDGQGHLHYRVDDGPVIATPTARLGFHGLAIGAHRILVELVGNDHRPLGPAKTLELTVPPDAQRAH